MNIRFAGLFGSLEGTGHAPMKAALDAEIVRYERNVISALQILSAVAAALAFYAAFAVSRPLGLALVAYSCTLFAWFTFVLLMLDKGHGVQVLRRLNPLIEITIPVGITLIDAATQGPTYALSMSIPLQIYGITTALQILRLRKSMPVLVGLVGAAEYAAVYFLMLRPALTAEERLLPQYGTQMAMVRAAIIALGGLAATLVSVALRRAVGQAAVESRAQDLFGKYRILDEIASGGMGSVYRAIYCPEGGFERPVALKRVHAQLAKTPAFVDAFRREAELSSRLVHANVVQVLDFGRVSDTFFLAMEFIDGMTLADLIHRTLHAKVRMPPRLVITVGREVLSGLHFAHREARDTNGERMRIIHRDLNPPNVLVSRAGEVKVSDFGIARAIGREAQLVTRNRAGKVGYAAPEQLRGEPLDERCDLFAAGILLWEMLCQDELFFRDTDGATVHAVLDSTAPPPTTLRSDLSAEWDAFFTKALAKKADDRFQSALDMRAALDALAGADGVPRTEELAAFVAALPSSAAPAGGVATVEAPLRPSASGAALH